MFRRFLLSLLALVAGTTSIANAAPAQTSIIRPEPVPTTFPDHDVAPPPVPTNCGFVWGDFGPHWECPQDQAAPETQSAHPEDEWLQWGML